VFAELGLNAVEGQATAPWQSMLEGELLASLAAAHAARGARTRRVCLLLS